VYQFTRGNSLASPHILLISLTHSHNLHTRTRESTSTDTYYYISSHNLNLISLPSLSPFFYLLFLPYIFLSTSSAVIPFKMDFSSAKRGSHPAPAQGRKTERNRNQPQSRNAPLPPRQRQRHTDTKSYSYEAEPSQHHNTSYQYIDDQYPESISTQWERQPSAHISEIESVDGSQQRQGELEYEGYESETRLIQAPRSQGGRQSYAGVQQSFDEVGRSHPTERYTDV